MKFGLLGEKLSHSYSPLIHNMLFQMKNIDATYELIEINKNQIEDYIDKIRNKEYIGFNVTIPYKKEVMQYLDVIDEFAKEIGAVNTVYLKDGLVHGTNSDYFGFIEELKYYNIDVFNKDCYILGTGGASLAVKKALKDLNANYTLVSRNPQDNQINYIELFKRHIDLIVNTTPVGMYPNVGKSPIDEAVAKKAFQIVDIIFNPSVTKLMSYNKNSYNGLVMLLMQAAKSEDIWLNKTFDIDYQEIYLKLKKVIDNE